MNDLIRVVVNFFHINGMKLSSKIAKYLMNCMKLDTPIQSKMKNANYITTKHDSSVIFLKLSSLVTKLKFAWYIFSARNRV